MVKDFDITVDESGRLVFPEEVFRKYDLGPGTSIRLEDNTNGMRLRRPVTHLARVYIEPTNRCNLERTGLALVS